MSSDNNHDSTEELTALERMFIRAYVRSFCGADAYMEAGYSATDRSVAAGNAHALLQRPRVRAALAEAMDDNGLTRERIAASLGEMAYGGTIADVLPFIEGGTPLGELIADGKANAVQIKAVSVRPGKHGDEHRVEFVDRADILMKLAKIRGLSDERINLDITADIGVLKQLPDEELRRLAASLGEALDQYGPTTSTEPEEPDV